MEKNIESTSEIKPKMSIFERYLTLWVALAIVVGIVLGAVAPGPMTAISKLEYNTVNLPVALLIWLMIYPMMLKIDFSKITEASHYRKGLTITVVANWLIKPFTMFLFASLFFSFIFKAWISPDLAKQYLAGAILLGAAPCTAMVFVWSDLTNGDANYTISQVAINDLIILVAFVPIVGFLLGMNNISIPYATLITSVVVFVVIPLVAGVVSKALLVKVKGLQWYQEVYVPFWSPVSMVALLSTLVLLFAFQGDRILSNPFHILLIFTGIIALALFLSDNYKIAQKISPILIILFFSCYSFIFYFSIL